MRLDHEPTEPRRHVIGRKGIVRHGQPTEAQLVIVVRLVVMLVGPLDETIVDIIRRDQRLDVALGQHQTRLTYTIGDIVSLKEVVSRDDAARPAHDGPCSHARGPVVAQFHVVGVCVQTNRLPVLRIHRLFV